MTDQILTDRLTQIVETKRRELEELLPRVQAVRSEAEAAPEPRRFASALRVPAEVRLLAEVKRKSPSAGPIRPGADPVEVARGYEAGGAAALSVLTDRTYFDGSLDALRSVRAAVDLPVLRKDFIIDEAQVWEARAAGADAILLIARILADGQLVVLQELSRELGMDVLVEVHDRPELERAMAAGSTLIGINNRDLRTFRTNLELSFELAPEIDPKITLVAESGIRTPEDVQRLGACGVDAILVGEALMRQPDLTAAAAELRGHPRNPLVRRP